MSYNKDIDYQQKIDESVNAGDYKAAAKYEKERNEKIDGENLNYEKTNKYSGWLDDTDYGTVIQNQIQSGASKDAVSKTLKKRVEKASGTEGLIQFAYDDIYDEAVRYIMGANSYKIEERERYTPSYEDEIEALLKSNLNREKFSYDPYSDELYQIYRDIYRREGERAMEDTLGKIAANTGGVASSYATGAAAQARDYYNSKVADIVPELYKQKYDMYLDSIDIENDNLKMLLDMENEEYEHYRDRISDYENDREFNYNSYIDSLKEEYNRKTLENEKEQSDRDYALEIEKLLFDEKESDRDYEQSVKEWEHKVTQDKINEAIDKWKALGYLDEESARILNLPVGLHTTDYDYKQAQKYKIYNK